MPGLLGDGFDDPRSSAVMALAGGLLQGNFGGGLIGANNAFAQAKQNTFRSQLAQMQMQEAQQKMEDERRRREFLSNLPNPMMAASQQALAGGDGPTVANAERMPQVSPTQQLMFEGVRAGAIPLADYLKATAPKQLEFSKIDPKDYTPDSLRRAATTGDYTQLVPVRKMDVVNGQAVNLYNTQPGTVFDTNDPNQPFNLRGGQMVANTPFQQFAINKSRAGASVNNISVNTEKSLLNEVAGGLGKGLTTAKEAAQAAVSTIGTVSRLTDALDSGSVMAGPGTKFRQFGLQIGNMLGVSGKDAQEKLLNTRQAIQSLAQLELDAAQQMKGQGQITEAERSIIRRAASGDIDSMTTGELRVLAGVLDRTARSKIQSFNTQVKPLLSNPNAAPIAPFLSVEEPPQRSAPAATVRRFNPATGRIE